MVCIFFICVEKWKIFGMLMVCFNINNDCRELVLEKLCFVFLVNLIGYEDEKVGLENFEFFKVFGIGGILY